MNGLDPQSQKELVSFLEAENQKSEFRTQVIELTDLCWPRCVSKIKGPALEGSDKSCVANCVDRFLDSTSVVIQRMQQQPWGSLKQMSLHRFQSQHQHQSASPFALSTF